MLRQEGESIEKVMGEFLDFVEIYASCSTMRHLIVHFSLKPQEKSTELYQIRVSDALDMARRVYPGMPSYKLSELASVVEWMIRSSPCAKGLSDDDNSLHLLRSSLATTSVGHLQADSCMRP